MNLMKTILFAMLAFCALSALFVNAEYLVFKKSPDGTMIVPSNEEFEKTFNEVLRKYQFPLSLKLMDSNWDTSSFVFIEELRQSADYGRLTSEEFEELKKNTAGEQPFLQKKVHELNADLKIVFIPKTLFELLMIRTILNNLKSGVNIFPRSSLATLSELNLELDSRSSMAINKFTIFGKYMRYFFSIIKNLSAVNAASIEWMNDHKLTSFEALSTADIDRLVTGLINEVIKLAAAIDDPENSLKKGVKLTLAEFSQAKELIAQAIALEIEAQKKGKYVIYRGTNGFGPYIDLVYAVPLWSKVSSYVDAAKLDIKEVAIGHRSYGKSLFAGFAKEVKGGAQTGGGANVLEYFKIAKIAYALLVDMNDYYNQGFAYRLLTMPSQTIFEDFICDGETFHPVTRQYKDSKISEQEFQAYLRNNVHILKNATSFTAQQLLDGDNMAYYNWLTDILKKLFEGDKETWKKYGRQVEAPQQPAKELQPAPIPAEVTQYGPTPPKKDKQKTEVEEYNPELID